MNKMNKSEGDSRFLPWLMALLLSALAAGCGGGGGGQSPILGGGGVTAIPPTVTAVAPLLNATGVPINTKIITAAFSTAMDPATLTTSSFTLACPAGTAQAGSVGYTTVGNVATLTLTNNLPAGVICTARITTGAKNTGGTALASDFTWTFTTGAAPDTTAPLVSLTVPLPGATGVALNTLVSATFNEPMDPTTITSANVKLTCPGSTAITGTVAYAVNGDVATFTPASALPASALCTGTITTGVKDVAGNALANTFTWTFTTGAAPDTTAPTVRSTVPLANASGVVLNSVISATFSEPMNPLTITTANMKVACPLGGLSTGIVTYAVVGNVATFRPAGDMPAGITCTATVTTGVTDVAGNAMASPYVWTFTTLGGTPPPPPPSSGPGPAGAGPNLGAAATFGFLSSAALTNEGNLIVVTGDPVRLTGDAGTTAASGSITGLHDAIGSYTENCPGVNCGRVTGTIYATDVPAGDGGVTVAAAHAAALNAYSGIGGLSPAQRPGGQNVSTCVGCGGGLAGELGNRTLAPGIYYSGAGGVATYSITAGDLTLDAGGNPNAVFIFQTDAALTVGGVIPRSVILTGQAQPKNVYWYVGSAATINTGSAMVGTIISSATITFGTAGVATLTTLAGRALVLTAGATMVNTVITVPAP